MRSKTAHLTLTALFVALILLFGSMPFFLIPLGFINVTILHIPVIVGTLLLGLKTGLLFGACFGTVSALSAFNLLPLVPPSALAAPLVAASPALALIMCYVPRLLIPVVTTLVYRLIARGRVNSKRAVPFAAVLGSLTNTVFYLGLMLLFYVIMGIDHANLLALIGGTGLIAGTSEAVVAAIIATPVLAALWKIGGRK